MAALMSNMSPGSSAAVLFTKQNLTEGQKSQARENIDTISTNDLELSVADWSQDDENALNYIKNKPTEDDALELVIEMGLVDPISDENNVIYTDENNLIYTL